MFSFRAHGLAPLMIAALAAAPALALASYEVIDLRTVPGETFEWGCAYGLDDLDQIVGRANTDKPSTHAVLFDPTGGGGIIDLNDCIDPNSGWLLEYAYAINSSGWIIGQGLGPGEPVWPCGYLLRPVPEPSTLDLMALGILPALWLGRRGSSARR